MKTESANIPTAAEASLRPVIKYWVVELMDCGGTTPEATCDWVCEEEPSLCKALGKKRVLELCKRVHHSEEPGQSEWYQVRFNQFNKEFFGGDLPTFRIRVVYEVPHAMSDAGRGPQSSAINLERREIFLRLSQAGVHHMECELVHHMAHASTETDVDDDPKWLQEMERLRALGAPIDPEGE